MFRVSFYSRYFDINTDEFLGKIILALNPLNNTSVVATHSDSGPTELYGFVWINATIVFLMFVSSTGANLLAQWLHASKKDQAYEYDFRLLTLSISFFYGYTVAVPALSYVVSRWVFKFQDQLSLTRMILIYSYAGVFWMPATVANLILAVFISDKKHHGLLITLQWGLVAIAGFLSGLSILVKVRPFLIKNCSTNPLQAPSDTSDAANAHGRKESLLLTAAIVVLHLAFIICVKIFFFGIK